MGDDEQGQHHAEERTGVGGQGRGPAQAGEHVRPGRQEPGQKDQAAERLGSAPLPPTYFAILVLKVALGIWMFASARHFGAQSSERPRGRAWSRPEYVVLVLGVVIYALAIALRTIYDDTIRA